MTALGTGFPVDGARVCAYLVGMEAAPAGCATTDNLGEYSLLALPSGEYVLRFDKGTSFGDYAPAFWEESDWREGATPLVEANHLNVNAKLKLAGRIAGRVSAVGGTALGGVSVCAHPQAALAEAPVCDQSAGDGSYLIGGLPPGSYSVAFSDPASAYEAQFYDGKAPTATPTPVKVREGETEEPIDATLVPVPPIPGPVIPSPPQTSVPSTPTPTPVAAPPPPTPAQTSKPIRCGKGKVRKSVKGKARCVKKHKPRHHKKHRAQR